MSPPASGASAPGIEIRAGVDLVPVARLVRLASDVPEVIPTIFTARELAYCEGRRHRHQHLAARFAAKEAVLKSFGTGLGQQMRWLDVEIVNEIGGRPCVVLHGEVAILAARRGLIEIDVSLSHTTDLAIAHAVATWQRVPEDQASAPARPDD